MDAVPGKAKIGHSLALIEMEPQHHFEIGGVGEGRRIEMGVMQRSMKRVWSCCFEGFPLWLLVLTRNNTSKVILNNWSCFSHFETFLRNHTSLAVVSMFQSLGMPFFVFDHSIRADVVLCSGSLSFIRTKSQSVFGKGVFLLNTPWRARRFPGFAADIKWRIYTPDAYGGAVQVNVLIGFKNLEPMEMNSTLSRAIVHHLNFGEKPRYFDPCGRSLAGYYVPEDKLQINSLQKSVVYPTHFFRTGFGVCELTSTELGHCFGLTTLQTLRFNTADFENMLPVQPLRNITSWLAKGDSNVYLSKQSIRVIPTARNIESVTWLPNLQRFLKHDWLEAGRF